MTRISSILTGALALGVSTGALAVPVAVAPGLYLVTTQYTSVSDPSGICGSAGVSMGGTTSGIASIGGVSKTAISIVAQPTTAAGASGGQPYAVNNLTCKFPAFPATISNNGSTPYNGTTVCTTNYSPLTGGPATFDIVATNANIVTTGAPAVPDTENTFHIVSTGDAIQSGGATLCTINTDQLFQRTGK